MNKEAKVGLTAITSVLILVLGIMWGKDIKLSDGQIELRIKFSTVSGLNMGDPVAVNGIKMGTVKRFYLDGDSVVVLTSVNSEIQLYSDMRATLEVAELMGGKKIEIWPGLAGEPLDYNKVHTGEYSTGILELAGRFDELTNNVGLILGKLEVTVDSINAVLRDDVLRRSLVNSIENLEKTSESARLLLADNRGKFDSTLVNLYAVTIMLKDLADRRGGMVDTGLVQIAASVDQLTEISNSLESVMNNIENQEGTLGKLIYSDQIYNDLTSSVETIQAILTDIKNNPEKYLKNADIQLIKLFDF